MGKLKILISGPEDRERLVAEIYYDEMYWAEVSQEKENGPFMIQLYSHPENLCWEFNFEEAVNILSEAKKSLIDLDDPDKKSKLWDLI